MHAVLQSFVSFQPFSRMELANLMYVENVDQIEFKPDPLARYSMPQSKFGPSLCPILINLNLGTAVINHFFTH